MSEQNTWGLVFNYIDDSRDEFIELLGLNLGDEERARNYFNKIKDNFESENNECIVDLVDEEDSIIDDYPLSKKQVEEIAFLFGHDLTK